MSINPFSLKNNENIYKSIPWWIEILTAEPNCLYYFGPFDTMQEAHYYQSGYIEDLKAEKASVICVEVKQCYPQILTQED